MRRLLQQDRPSAAQTVGRRLHPSCSECCICSESFSDMLPTTEVCVLPCKHSFCASCIEHWFHESDQNSCPVCRRVYSGLRRCFKTAAGIVEASQTVQQELERVAVDRSSSAVDEVELGLCDDCGGEGRHDSLVFCAHDGCNTTLHLQCVQPKLHAMPAGWWFCCRSDDCTFKAKQHEWRLKASRQRKYKAPTARWVGEARATTPKGLCPLQWLQRECTARGLSAGGHISDLCDRLTRWELKISGNSRTVPHSCTGTDSDDSCSVVLKDATSEVAQANPNSHHSPAGPTKTSRFVGVSWNKAGQRWEVRIKNSGQNNYIGYFDDEEAAARAYDAAALEVGRSAVNFATAGASDDNDVSTTGSDSECCSSGCESRRTAGCTKRSVQQLARPSKTSRFVGVWWDKARHRWAVRIRNGGIQKHIGRFDDEKAAARAYEGMMLPHWSVDAV